MGEPINIKSRDTIPKPIGDHLGFPLGSFVDFAMDDAGRIILRKAGAEAEQK